VLKLGKHTAVSDKRRLNHLRTVDICLEKEEKEGRTGSDWKTRQP